MNPALTISLATTATALTGVSITCEIALFTSFAETELDQTLAAITGAGLVASQFLLVWVLQEHLKNGRNALATGVFLLITALFGVSVIGTAAWLETRFQEKHQASVNSTQEHQLITQLLADFEKQANSLRQQAVLDRNSGNHWRAGERLKEAAQADQQRLQALAMLKKVESVPSSSGQSLASSNNHWRWGLWLLLATLVDLCPLLCFASLKNPRPRLPETLKETPTETPTATTPLSPETPKEAPTATTPMLKETQATPKATAQAEKPEETPVTPQPPYIAPVIPIRCTTLEQHLDLLTNEIQAGVYPNGVSIRAVMKRHHLGYRKARSILDKVVYEAA
jgi:hypothetical protein